MPSLLANRTKNASSPPDFCYWVWMGLPRGRQPQHCRHEHNWTLPVFWLELIDWKSSTALISESRPVMPELMVPDSMVFAWARSTSMR